MTSTVQKFGFFSGLLAFILCLTAGLWILTKTGLDHANDVVSVGLGLYFIGKAFFVGPMLMIVSARLECKNNA